MLTEEVSLYRKQHGKGQIPPWYSVFLQYSIGIQLLKEFRLYGTRCFISRFKKARYRSLSWATHFWTN